MSLTLPPIAEGKFLTYKHFPTQMQCFIYRNWGVVEAWRLAKVLGTNVETVRELAVEMGLDFDPDINPNWMTAGYITIIKANWQLLSYEQLCLLLDWDQDKLAYILKEDDFLDHKLGNFKPDSPPLRYSPLTAEQKARTAAVKAATIEARAAIDARKLKDSTKVEPFDFVPFFLRGKAAAQGSLPANTDAAERFDTRIVYSYCALYGDTFMGDTTQSFPDELLEAYQALGVNGIWCQAVLYTLVPFKYMPELSKGWRERLDGLRALTERFARYNIKLYLYINEPRAMPEGFFEKYPNLKGAERNQLSSICTSVPEIRDYLRESAAMLVENAPKLGGFITITASENMTNCYSHFNKSNQNCPRCSQREKYEVIAEVNRTLYEGAASVNPDFKLLAWTWGWDVKENFETIDLMPPEIGVMAVSERLAKKTIGGIETDVNDYSISIVGPGDYALGVWRHARERGHRAYAKCQFNNTWECASVPFLPVFDLVYKHISGLIKSGVGGLMLDWTLGGYPSPTFAMLRGLYHESDTVPSLDELYAEVFPKESIEIVKSASKLFSDAFEEYPFHIGTLYSGPQNAGPSNLLYDEPTGFSASMVCFHYDDLNRWRAIFPEEVFENQYKLLTEGWAKGLEVLSKLDAALIAANPVLAELIDSAEAAYCHFRSVYLQTRFVRIRDGSSDGDMSAVVEEEMELCARLAAVVYRNPTIGYESSNHYFYSNSMLLEKYVNCKYIKDQLCKK